MKAENASTRTKRPVTTRQTTRQLLSQRLELIFRWYQGMVNADTGMLEYLYLPQTDAFVREKSPIRDIGSIWDVELLSEFLNKSDLQPLIEKSLPHYVESIVEHESCLTLDSRRLGEPSSIAHSAFMILSLAHGPAPPDAQRIAGLAEGILRQQRANGSYKIYFHDLPDEGEELYGGEAMLPMMEAYQQSRDTRYMDSARRGFGYYDKHYFRQGRVGDDLLVFFANWQSQACRLLFEHAYDPALKRDVAGYVHRMHDRIIDGGFYDHVRREATQQVSVEVACALEGLNEACALPHASEDEQQADRYRQCACAALQYLLELQCTRGGTETERGGFGMSLEDPTQRIDVTGHAASAFMKSVQNGIECHSPTH